MITWPSMMTAAAGMHVEPSSPLDSSIAAMWFLPILNMGVIPLLGLHFQVSGIFASGGDKRPSCTAGRLGRYCGKPRSPFGELMTKGQGQKRRMSARGQSRRETARLDGSAITPTADSFAAAPKMPAVCHEPTYAVQHGSVAHRPA